MARLRRGFLLFAYYAYAKLAVFLLGRGAWRVWCRNSFALRYWDADSDLDLTLCPRREGSVLPERLRAFAEAHARFGEWAVFDPADRRWIHFANPFELERDPRLGAVLGPPVPRATDAFSYWCRMYGADARLRAGEAKGRRRKWAFHLEQLRRTRPELEPMPFPEFIPQLFQSLAGLPEGYDPERIFREKANPLRKALLPHEWVRAAAPAIREGALGEFARDSRLAPFLEMSRAQIRWDLWGVLGQIRLRRDKSRALGYVSDLGDLLPAGDSLRGEAEDFLEYLRGIAGEAQARMGSSSH